MTNTSKLKYTNARLLAIQTIYAQALSGEEWDKVISRFLLSELGGQVLQENNGKEEYITIEAADSSLFTKIVQGYRDNQGEVQTAIQSGLSEKIIYQNLDLTFLCILQAAISEFYINPELPTPIIISEYVDITRSFFDGAEIKIANALLDKFSKIIR